ncbi:MAG: phage tail sheath N-terminal beta-sandwich domain-containing protein [Solirubrobacteraceae bacterium]
MPGVNEKIAEAPSTPSDPTDTGKLFVLAQVERGSTTEHITCHSMPEVLAKVGGKIAQSYLRDALEAFFEEGGSTVLLARVVGATPVAASVELETAGHAKSIKVAATNVGEWGNNLKVQVKAGEAENSYRLLITENSNPVSESPDLLTQAAAVTWSEGNAYVTVTVLGGSGVPAVVAATELTGGTQDFSHVTTPSWEAALALFPHDLGCGQFSILGNTTEAVQKAVLKHCEEKNRCFLADLTNTTTSATLITAAASLRTVAGARRGAAYAPWAIIPGLAPGTTRIVPYSAIQAGIIARNDASEKVPPINEPSAGENGKPRYAIGLTAEWSRSTREVLNEGSVNVARNMPGGGIETYGNRTLVKPETEPAWEEFTASRLYMYVLSEGEAIMETFEFKQIDRFRVVFSRVGAKIQAFLETLGTQLANNPAEAVNTGPGVNTEQTTKEKKIIAAVTIQPAGIAETAEFNLTTQGV